MAILSWKLDEHVQAYRFAAEANNGQKIPGTDLPYIIHPDMVSMELMAALQDEQELNGDLLLKCALLHEVI
jgi:guanosine-3',5'-bis(diphosphate) 3'-pyrophosphohydrolase